MSTPNLFKMNKEKEKKREKNEKEKSTSRGLCERLGFGYQAPSPVPALLPQDPPIATAITSGTDASLVTATPGGTAMKSTDTIIPASALPSTHQQSPFPRRSHELRPVYSAVPVPIPVIITSGQNVSFSTTPAPTSMSVAAPTSVSYASGDDDTTIRSGRGYTLSKTIWSGCQTALHVANESTDVFPPAKSAVSRLLAVIDLLEVCKSPAA